MRALNQVVKFYANDQAFDTGCDQPAKNRDLHVELHAVSKAFYFPACHQRSLCFGGSVRAAETTRFQRGEEAKQS